MRVRLLVPAVAFAALALLAAAAGTAAGPDRASSNAIVVLIRIPGQPDQTIGLLSAPPRGRIPLGATDVAGGVVTIGRGSTEVQTGPGGAPRGQASVELHDVSLFGGEVTIDRLVARATATAGDGSASGDFGGTVLEGFSVLGGPLGVVENARADLGGFGYAITLEQAIVRSDDQGPGWRGFVTALHVTLTKDHGGLPAGSEILIGYAEAAARPDPVVGAPAEAEPETEDVQESEDAPAPADEPAPAPPGAQGGPPPIVRNPPPDVRPDITGAGYVFPVWGQSSFGDDFAAPRADTIWHHGNDLFAPLGAPVLAATDGELFLVGWNRLGGHRLWLRDDQGNEYYYAHLSAYSPLAVDGARVRAGDVLGFVGMSGVAGGVPHLHFEIHPRALLGLGYDGVINPYTYLLAWEASHDRRFDVVVPGPAGGQAPKPGAVLLGVQDISTASGLDREALRRALELPYAFGLERGIALSLPRPPLVGAAPGFPRG